MTNETNILNLKVNGEWVGVPAIKGDDGEGVPTGGTTGQVLKKKSATNYDTEWGTVDALPSQTGESGKFLTTNGTTASWQEIPTETDDETISLNSNDELQAIGVIDSRDSSTALKTWTGTTAQYNAIATKDSNTLYNITDDTDITLTLLQTIYPVGSIYITTNSTCPLSALFGTWTAIGTDERYIIETNENGTEGYRIWSDGYCEQWGRITTSAYTTTISFTKTFSNTNYIGVATNITGAYTNTYNVSFIPNTTSTATINTGTQSASTITWQASGYLASGQYTVTNAYNKFKRTA